MCYRNFKIRLKHCVRLSLAFLLIIPLLQINTLTAQASTQVGGPIISDTTWTLTNSPYIVIASVEVWEDVTLTIEPGVTVKFNSGFSLQVNGELIAQGTALQPITFTSNQLSPAPDDWGNIEFTDTAITTTMGAEGEYISGSILQYCVVEYAGKNVLHAIDAHSLLIDHCTVRNNNARGIYNSGTQASPGRITYNTVSDNSATEYYVFGGGIYAILSTVSNNTVSDNTVIGNSSCGGGIYAVYSTVSHNVVSNNTVIGNVGTEYSGGGGIYASNSTVSDNTVSVNSAAKYNDRGGGIHATNSMVSNNTVSGNSATGYDGGGGGIYSFSSTLSGNIIIGNMATGDYGKGGGIYVIGGTVSNNTISGNFATEYNGRGGGIYAGSSAVSNNTVSGNSAPNGGGIYASGSTVSNNAITSNSASDNGGGIYAENSSAVMTNTVAVNTVSDIGQGSGVYYNGGTTNITGNTIVDNTTVPFSPTAVIGGLFIRDTPQVHHNNLYGNDPYDVVVFGYADISGTLNYWGTVNSVDILAQIYDWYDNSILGKFLYVPFLQEPSPDAPFPPPLGLVANFQGNSVSLSWEALPSFTTGWGYKVYYDDDSSLPPFTGTGLNEGDAPIDVGDQTTFTLTGLDPAQDYYFAVTAYDNEGHESWYSNIVLKRGGYWIYLALVRK